MPKQSGCCYLVAEGTGWSAFVPIPGGVGYFKTHWCVVVTPCTYPSCTYPSCKAPAGSPCLTARRNPTVSTHVVRREAAKKMKSDPTLRLRLARAMPVVAFALDALAAAFNPRRGKTR